MIEAIHRLAVHKRSAAAYHNWRASITCALLAFLTIVSSALANSATAEYEVIEWTDLMPAADLRALEAMPATSVHDESGPTLEEQITRQIEQAVDEEQNRAYLDALKSEKVRPEWNGKAVKVPGFIVPLEFDDNQVVTEFFLVPYFGACIHVPPPPPNQIIHVTSKKGFKLDELYTPFWIYGTLKLARVSNEMATSVYAMQADKVEIYVE